MDRTRKLLREYGYRPKKHRGQNFLVREDVLRSITAAARVSEDETVVEIGPGPGNLTRRLADQARLVVAIEIEPELTSLLKAELRADNVKVVRADALDMDFRELAREHGRLKIVANIPYGITTPLLFKFLDTPEFFSEIFLLVQKEVARRVAAAPGKKPYGILAARTQLMARPEIVLEVGPEAFSPRPKVDSALLRLSMRDEPLAPVGDLELYGKVVRASFAQRRKKLRNSFTSTDPRLGRELAVEAMEEAGVSPDRRAETVTVEEFAALTNALAERLDANA